MLKLILKCLAVWLLLGFIGALAIRWMDGPQEIYKWILQTISGPMGFLEVIYDFGKMVGATNWHMIKI